MLARRIIPCLDCDLGSLEAEWSRELEFKQIRYAGVPGSWPISTIRWCG